MGERNKDCTLGNLCTEKVVGQKPHGVDIIHLSGVGTSPDVSFP